MKGFFGTLVRLYAALAGFLLLVVAVNVAVLFGSGALNRARIGEAVAVLRRPPGAPAPAPAPGADVRPPAEDAGGGKAELEQRRAEELRGLEDRIAIEMARLKAERQAWEADRARTAAAEASARAALRARADAEADAELGANVPILSKMDGPGIVSLLREWDDARFVAYLRALRPSKAAEVLETLRTDPQFEEEFRRVPPGAPPGTPTRAERLAAELKQAP